MRLFVALDVPDDVRAALDAALAPQRGEREDLGWTPPHQWHVTLAFIGHVDPDEAGREATVARLADAIDGGARQAPPSLELSLSEAGRFGKRVLWIGVADAPRGAVADLGRDVQAALRDEGLDVDDREVHPHLTLARSRRRRSRGVDRRLVASIPAVEASWTAEACVLFESVRRGHGEPNVYEALARIPLGGGAAPR